MKFACDPDTVREVREARLAEKAAQEASDRYEAEQGKKLTEGLRLKYLERVEQQARIIDCVDDSHWLAAAMSGLPHVVPEDEPETCGTLGELLARHVPGIVRASQPTGITYPLDMPHPIGGVPVDGH